MHRRHFFTAASSLGIAATGCAQSTTSQETPTLQSETGTQSGDGVVIHPWKSDVMSGFPPAPENLVTRENQEDSQEKLRWAMQHYRELFPTQRVSRGDNPFVALPRKHRDIMGLEYQNAKGEKTTAGKQVRALVMDAFIVVHQGKILCEEYFHGMRPETPHMLYSINKSIVSSVIATLLGESLKPDQKIERYVPELKDTAYAGATIRQILDMESGVLYRYTGDDPEVAAHEKAISPDAEEHGGLVGDYNFIPKLKAEEERAHGKGMRYKESDPAVLVWAAEKVTGKRFADILSERIWGPLGCEFDMDAVCDPLGHFTHHLSCCLRDLARWGLMCLNKGQLNGNTIVPADFFNDIQQNASVDRLANSELTGDLFPPGTGYRSFFYHHRDNGGAIAAAGAYGQFCYMNPSSDVVIAFFSSTEPWGAQLAAKVPFEKIFEKDRANELERRHLCHEIAKRLE
jgi:CubicO group peptidase (beta-lactamase class C family)